MIKIFTDGGCSGNPGPGAAAMIVIEGGEQKYSEATFEMETTNNRMELSAMILALSYAIREHVIECRIFSDSMYVINGMSSYMNNWAKNGWKLSTGKPVKNVDLWHEIYELWKIVRSNTNSSIHHVEGHSGNIYNESVDKIVKTTIKRSKNGQDSQ